MSGQDDDRPGRGRRPERPDRGDRGGPPRRSRPPQEPRPAKRQPPAPSPRQKAAEPPARTPRQKAAEPPARTPRPAAPAGRSRPVAGDGPQRRQIGTDGRQDRPAGPTARTARAPQPPRPPRRRPATRWRPPPDPSRRLRVALIGMLFLLSLFGGRLVQVQGFDAEALAAEALENRTHTEPLFAHRGDIVDARGAVLATTIELRDIRVDQTLVGKYKRRVGETKVPVGLKGAAEDLSRLLGVPADTLAAQLKGSNRGATIARGVRPDVAREILRLAVPGLYAYQASRRVYDGGQLGANVLGWVDREGVAKGGIEQALDSALAGTNGELVYEKGLDGARIPTGVLSEKDPKDGCTVRLTIDRDLQWKAQQLLAAQVARSKAKHGYAVVLDARTFAVRALATVPTFDPNRAGAATQDTINDRGMLDTFEPGSTAKVITLAAALQEGLVTPTTRFTVPPFLRRSDMRFRDSEPHGTEPLTLAGVLAQSSNIGTILAGEKMSSETLSRYLRLFGLGTPTGVGLAESPGLLADWRDWDGTQRYTVMFGQGLSVTALQAAGVFATLANDGVRLRPQVVAGRTCEDGVYRPAAPGQPLRVVDVPTARAMRLMMEQVVSERGTAVKAAIPGYRVAGKTGTAQVPGNGGYVPGAYVASFIGMAPADDPRLVVAVVIDRPTKGGRYGGEVAAPVFRDLTAWALRQGRIPPTGTTPERIPLRW